METTVNLRRKDTTKGPPLRILSLDGGGVRGYSMLILLQELMYRTYVECEGKAPRRDEIPKPCDHFDLIVGTGTGGLIAIMLGRLRLDIETCKEVYVRMTKMVFETDKTIAGIPYRSTLFKASRLEEAIKQCVREHTVFESEGNDMGGSSRDSISPIFSPSSVNIPRRTLSRGSVSTVGASSPSTPVSQRNSTFINGLRWGNPDALLYDNREFRTKTAVTALYKGTPRNGPAALLRSYDSRKEPPPEFNCTIWQAGRATCATGLAFKPIQIGQHYFIDEGAGTYNPAPLVLDEATVNEWPGREVGVFVSIGTGKRPAGTNGRQHEWWESFFSDALGTFAEARRRLIAKIEGCEDIHNAMLRDHLAKRNVSKDNYYRLNVEVGVGEFGMNEWNRLADISTSTRRYLSKPDVQKMNLSASVKLAKIERMHRRLAAHAAAANAPDEETVAPGITSLQQMAVPPPSNPMAVELPAELPADIPFERLSVSQPSVHLTSPQDKFSIMASDEPSVSEDQSHIHPAFRTNGDNPFRYSFEHSRPSSQQQSSPRHSTDSMDATHPPPVPPKTPIPYPVEEGGIMMPLPPATAPPPLKPHHHHSSLLPPYPVDGPPPAVNKLRKPTYNVR
ncbi:hypothetical protein Plec18167_007109 [Paecilomyces lecythidis]|uniref:PNPLA domain-containing protein n=1 Tax=Paecilomyces lecythidis TaxID=3004212 RepID=A0ABR3X7I3_9EURO